MNPLKALRDMRTIGHLLTDAETLALARGDEQPGAEHLLLAALDLPEGSARRAFERLGVGPDQLRAALDGHEADALIDIGIDPRRARLLEAPAPLDPATGTGVYRSRVSAQEAFQAASAMARSAKVPLAGAHVVAAVAGLEHGTAARVLAAIGVDRRALADAALEELHSQSR